MLERFYTQKDTTYYYSSTMQLTSLLFGAALVTGAMAQCAPCGVWKFSRFSFLCRLCTCRDDTGANILSQLGKRDFQTEQFVRRKLPYWTLQDAMSCNCY